MNDQPEYTHIPADLMCQRAYMMDSIAQTLHQISDPDARLMMLQAMDCLLFSINPPRGQVVELKNG